MYFVCQSFRKLLGVKKKIFINQQKLYKNVWKMPQIFLLPVHFIPYVTERIVDTNKRKKTINKSNKNKLFLL